MKKSFFKMQAAGNDFVLFDNRKKDLPPNLSLLARQICRRKIGIGADGMLVLENPPDKRFAFRMYYYNADGSRAEMCANGARCISWFAQALKIVGRKFSFQTDAGEVNAEVINRKVKLMLTPPKDIFLDKELKIKGKEYLISYINTGVPHTVLFFDDLQKVDLEGMGEEIRFHPQFAPQGTNVNFVRRIDEQNLEVRTYERGVEGETLACGTGVVASALVASLKELVKPPVNALTRSGEVLKVYFSKTSWGIKEVYLEGEVNFVYSGEIEIRG